MIGKVKVNCRYFAVLTELCCDIIAFQNTYGWARAEVLGALVNAVFLVALCFSITVESLKRFYEPEDIHDPVESILIVTPLSVISSERVGENDLEPRQNGREAQHKARKKQNLSDEISDIGVTELCKIIPVKF